MDREDMKHHMNMLLMEGRLHLAPIAPKPTKILDVGTGTGKWWSALEYLRMTNHFRYMGYRDGYVWPGTLNACAVITFARTRRTVSDCRSYWDRSDYVRNHLLYIANSLTDLSPIQPTW